MIKYFLTILFDLDNCLLFCFLLFFLSLCFGLLLLFLLPYYHIVFVMHFLLFKPLVAVYNIVAEYFSITGLNFACRFSSFARSLSNSAICFEFYQLFHLLLFSSFYFTFEY